MTKSIIHFTKGVITGVVVGTTLGICIQNCSKFKSGKFYLDYLFYL